MQHPIELNLGGNKLYVNISCALISTETSTIVLATQEDIADDLAKYIKQDLFTP